MKDAVALSILIALGFRLVLREFLLHAIAVSLIISFALLAYSTKMALTKLYSLQFHWKESALPICCAVALGVCGLIYHNTSNCSMPRLVALELGFGLVFLGVCFYYGVRWVQILCALMFPQTWKLETADHLMQP